MKLTADLITAQTLINDPKPDGLAIQSASSTKAINLNIDLNVTVDVAKLAAPIVASWILSRAIRKGANVKVNGESLPPDESAARKVIMDAIDADQKKNASGE